MFFGCAGYITSDCDADNDVVASHHYLNHSAAEGVADVLHAVSNAHPFFLNWERNVCAVCYCCAVFLPHC